MTAPIPERLIWVTGLAGSGKTTIGRGIYTWLRKRKPNVVFLDGDELRQVLSATEAHGPAERLSLAMTYCRLCKALCEQGIEVVCATISLFRECHRWNREHFPRYFEVYLDVPLGTLVARDHNRLYSRALTGDVRNVVGLDLEFAPPPRPDLVIRNDGPWASVDSLVQLACERLEQHRPDAR